MLTVNEIFYSIQGESTRAGRRCVFVRLTACDLRCSWCDTPYAFHEGRRLSLDDVLAEVERADCPLDEVKFVVKERADYEFARDVMARFRLAERAAAVHLSPVHGVLAPRELAAWVLADRLPARGP